MQFRRKDALNFWLRSVEKRKLAWLPTVDVQRKNFELQAMGFAHARGLDSHSAHVGGIPCRVLTPEDPRGTLLYLHGGAYIMGSSATHTALAGTIARANNLAVVIPDYRLAPEHPFPAAFEDALCVAQALDAVSGPLFIGGDSAGGGLTLAVLSSLCVSGQHPAAAFVFSPWTDLSFQSETLSTNAHTDAILPVERIYEVRTHYLCGASPEDHRASPLFAAFPECPPVLLQWSDSEVLAGDGRRMAEHLRAQGAQVHASEWEDLPHVWQLFHDNLEEADDALLELDRFINAQFETSETTR